MLTLIRVGISVNTADPFTGGRMSKPTKKATGARRMKQLDYVGMKVWIKREKHNEVRRSAEMMSQSIGEFVRHAIELHTIRCVPVPKSD